MGVDGYMTYGEAAEALGVQTQRVRQLVKRGQLEGVTVGGVPHVTPASVEARIASKPRAGNPNLGREAPDMPDGYMTAGDAADVLGVDVSRISALVQSGHLDGERFGGWWGVTRESVEARAAGEGIGAPSKGAEAEEVGGYMKLTDAAKALGISKGRLSILVRDGTVKARKEGKFTLVPVSEVERRKATNPGHGNPNWRKRAE